jgi:lipopolysaccharide transport system ATP-binding protein
MHRLFKTSSTTFGDKKTSSKHAVCFSGVRKEYRLYNSLTEQAMDVLGLSRLRFWRPAKYRTFVALDEIGLEIEHGEKVGIIGQNGAGKTTLLKLITGNFTPTAGKIEVNGEVQALMQTGVGFHGEFTGYENIRSSLIYNGLGGKELEEAVDDIVDFCELGDFLHQPIKTYSLGMRTRLQFAAATAIKPEIVIIDEVLGAGDAYFSVKSAERMERMARIGCTMLIVSHSMSQIIQFCNRAVWIRDGKIYEDGDVREIVGDYEVYCSMLTKNKEAEQKLLKKIGKEAEKAGGLKVMLDDGTIVHRWASEKGVKLAGFALIVDGDRTHQLNTMEPAVCQMRIECEINDEFHCRYFVSIFTVDGTRVARFESDIDHFSARQGEVRDINFEISSLLLGPGEYFLNVSIFEAVDNSPTGKKQRYELLSRFYPFQVHKHLDYQEPVLFYHPAKWSFGCQKHHENHQT